MKLNTLLISLGLFLTLSSSLSASTEGQRLFDEKCSTCHIKTKPTDFSTLIAPPAMGVVRHVKMNYDNKKDAVQFITEYTLNPQRDKAVCTPNTIDRFGLMPSQKDNVTEEELKKIAAWMYDNINLNRKSCNSKCNTNCNAKKAKKNTNTKNNTKASPFLITTRGMPHLTKMVKQNWDNKELRLTQEQKEKLLIVRKATMGAVMDLKPKVLKLEKKIKMLTMQGETPQNLYPMVEKLSKLKADATKVHIDCIHNTKKILTSAQIKILLQR